MNIDPQMQPIDPTTLNPGIRQTVAFLRQNGFNTCDSGDGETHEYECDQPVPYVHMRVNPSSLVREAARLYGLMAKRVTFTEPVVTDTSVTLGPMIEAHYSPHDDIATISLWHVNDRLLLDSEVPADHD